MRPSEASLKAAAEDLEAQAAFSAGAQRSRVLRRVTSPGENTQ